MDARTRLAATLVLTSRVTGGVSAKTTPAAKPAIPATQATLDTLHFCLDAAAEAILPRVVAWRWE